jgi:hypothetical protein
MTENQDPRWVNLRPSNTNLALTLLSALLACAALWLIDIPDWVRATILLLALIVLLCDVYIVRFKSANAIAAFYLFERDIVLPQTADTDEPSHQRVLCIRLRYANPSKRKSSAPSEVEGVVTKSPYVSTYFTSIPYQLPDDPKWRRWMPRVLALWADGLDREQFRQVRVQLKWQKL